MDKTRFSPSQVLRQNLRAAMEARKLSQSALAKVAGVGQNTISRILSPQGENTTIENLGKLASKLGLEAWQLLVAGMDPDNPPVLQPVSKEEKALYDRLKATATALANLQK